MRLALALLLPALAAVLFVKRATGRRPYLSDVAAVTAVALGVASVLWFAAILQGVTNTTLQVFQDVVLWLLVCAFILMAPRRTAIEPEPKQHWSRVSTASIVVVLAVACLAVLSFLTASSVMPHGEWDAWAQWNLRARFLFRGFPTEWRQMFAPVLAWSHPDYPLLVSASVARLWAYAGRESTFEPILIAGTIAALTTVIAATSVARARGVAYGCLAAAAILACPSFVRYAASQLADIPLACYILVSFVALDNAARTPFRAAWWRAVAAASAALAAWTKNEGLVFLILFAIAFAIHTALTSKTGRLKSAVLFVLCIAPVLAAIAILKGLAPPSYFVAEQSLHQALSGLASPARAHAVAVSMLRELWLSGASVVGVIPALGAFVAIRGIRRPAKAAPHLAWSAMIVLMGSYAVAYLVSPKDLAWQLQTSLDRVVVQIVPTLAWSLTMIAR